VIGTEMAHQILVEGIDKKCQDFGSQSFFEAAILHVNITKTETPTAE
jgi:hypothetical protein